MWAIPALILSFLSGFVSLSTEILWIRIFAFANHSIPQAFAFVLLWFLVGIAIGANLGQHFCKPRYNLWRIAGIFMLVESLFLLLSPFLYARSITSPHSLTIAAICILTSAAMFSILFPIAHQLGTLGAKVTGKRISVVYMANIMGATLGPLITGLVLLDFLTVQQNFTLFAYLTLVVSAFCLYQQIDLKNLMIVILAIAMLLSFGFLNPPHQLIAKLITEKAPLIKVIENAHGIITIYRGFAQGDIVAGGNVYDGTTNLDPVINSNRINRLIILSALHDRPQKILLVGLSIGTWLKLVTSFPHVAQIDVVEINPGYLKAMSAYKAQQSALSDPRVHLYIDDGRRFLKSKPNNKYDMIISNTTFYWRAYSANLLSYEFLSLLKQHMNPHAILTFNSTNSLDAAYTAGRVFAHAYFYENFIIAADFDFREKLVGKAALLKLMQLKLDGKPLFTAASQFLANQYLHEPIGTNPKLENIYKMFNRQPEIITDNNLITEYKHGKNLDEVLQENCR